jgi:Txe/YoeB family toxin of Txe-Axe toxin-antitoxin module
MKVVFTESSWKDYLWFQENDRKLLKRINALIKKIDEIKFTIFIYVTYFVFCSSFNK